MLTVLRALAPVVLFFAALTVGTDRRLVRTLRAAGALDAARAIPLSPRSPLGRWRLHRLIGRGAVHEVGARFFLDETAFAAYRSARRRTVLTIAVPGIALVALIAWMRACA